MARHKDVEWTLPEKMPSWDLVNTALLMDIRDELKQLNWTFGCSSFQRIPAKLDRIGRNTERKRKKP